MIDPFATAIELAAAIRNKEASSLELTDMYIERVERYDGQTNAVVVHDFERGREAAKAADSALAKGESAGPLHGVPMTVKEAFNVTGLPTTWGIPELRDNIASEDADYVQRLKGAGAVIFGKTNVPLNLGDFQSFNDIYGTTNNPWDLTRTPGGSSGGSSAALAAGLTALEAGSDIGGSIRNPAHYCGVYGHKPTWGIVSDEGHALPRAACPGGHRRGWPHGAQRGGFGAFHGHRGRRRAHGPSRLAAQLAASRQGRLKRFQGGDSAQP